MCSPLLIHLHLFHNANSIFLSHIKLTIQCNTESLNVRNDYTHRSSELWPVNIIKKIPMVTIRRCKQSISDFPLLINYDQTSPKYM